MALGCPPGTVREGGGCVRAGGGLSDIQKTIADQIGWRELRMARFNFSRDQDNIIGVQKGNKGVRIEYDEGADTYRVTKTKVNPRTLDVSREELDDVYWEDLKGIIENHFKFEYVMQRLGIPDR